MMLSEDLLYYVLVAQAHLKQLFFNICICISHSMTKG